MKMSLEERIKRSVSKHPEWDDRRHSQSVKGAGVELIRAVKMGRPLEMGLTLEPAEAESKACGVVSLDQVRKRYDVAAAIMLELSRLEPKSFVLERELAFKTVGKELGRFRRTVETLEKLQAYRVKLKLDANASEGSWYWGRPEDVAEAKKLRDE